MPVVKTEGRPKKRAARVCAGDDCSKRTRRESGYCTACEPGANAEKRERKKRVRGSAGSTRAGRKLREKCLERDGHRCVKCGSTSDLHADHVIPLSKGGEDALSNLQTLCADCNLRKGAKLPEPVVRKRKPTPKPQARCVRCEKTPVRRPGVCCPDCLPTSRATSSTYARKQKGRR